MYGLYQKTGTLYQATDDVEDILDWTPLHHEVANSREILAWVLSSTRADVNARDIRGRTPLHYACQPLNHYSEIQSLLLSGAEIDIQDVEGRAPIYFAAMHGHTRLVQLLIEGGANVDVLDGLGHSPLAWAAYKGHLDVVSLLWLDC